jgi:carbon monoxide dehydrogenase subunit G
MINVEVSVVINRPLEEVFAFLSRLENNMKWRTGMIAAEQASAGPVGVGTTYRLVNEVLGRRIEGEAEVTEYVSNSSYATVNRSGLPIETRRSFEPVPGGTRVTFAVKADLGRFSRPIGPLVSAIGRRRLRSDALKVKQLIESGSANH